MPKQFVPVDDAHRMLPKRKRETGLNVQDIGSALLQSVLKRPPRSRFG